MNCACCGADNAAKNCIDDYLSGKTIILFTSQYCGCKFNSPVCSRCYSMYNGGRFNCRNCSKNSYFSLERKKRHETYMPQSISTILLQYNLPKSSKSRLFHCFGRMPFQFLNWNHLCEFYSQIDTQFLPAMFRIWLQIKAGRLMTSQNIFSLSYLMISYRNFKKCKKSDYMQNVIKMFQHFSFMMTCSKRMFNMSHLLDEKMFSIYLSYDSKFSSMISKRVLSRLVHSESDFIRSLA
jgi:hypothetical protein